MIGCALSHLALWVAMTKGLVPSPMIILEDDVELVPQFCDKLDVLLAQTRSAQTHDADVVFLGHHPFHQYRTPDLYDKQAFPVAERWTTAMSLGRSKGGTGGYFITKEGAHKLLEFIDERGMTNGIDTMMQKACDDMNIYYCTPHLVYSECYEYETMNTVDTDIQRNYDSMRRSFEERKQDEIAFYAAKGINVVFGEENPTLEEIVEISQKNVYMCLSSKCRFDEELTAALNYSYQFDKYHVHLPRWTNEDDDYEIGLCDQNGDWTIDNVIKYV